ncbi:MAG: hypothetical protein JWL90_4450 [Chthoniobacteraceae bacterium]|nr:hypothetical protein [Chthoniobacteraceae bacterium]
MSLHIGLIMQGGAGWMGGSEYIKNLAHALRVAAQEKGEKFEVSLISGHALDSTWKQELPELRELIQLPPRRFGAVGRYLKIGNRTLAAAVRGSRIGFAYPFTYDNEYNLGVSLPLGSQLSPCRWAGWIPDFQHRELPELFAHREIVKRDRGIALLARDARSIVFSSESAAAKFHTFYPGSTARAEVLRFCTSPAPAWYEADPEAVRRRYHLPDRFFLVSNQLWQHKNHMLVFDALERLSHRGIRPHVVCTGQPADFRDKNFINVILQRLHENGVAAQVSMLGLISRQEQIQLMRRSLAVVQPSLYEGWSTVVEDARVLGKPMALSDLDVHKEQNPPGAHYFDRHSPESLAELLARLWETAIPGPDLEKEAAAREAAHLAQAAFGRRFLEIARTP